MSKKKSVQKSDAKPGKALAVRAAKPVKVLSPERSEFALTALNSELASRHQPVPSFKVGIKDGTLEEQLHEAEPLDIGEYCAAYRAVGGADSSTANQIPVAMIANYAAEAYGSASNGLRAINEMLAQAAQIGPRDAIEGMLVSQMVSTYHQGMLALRKAAKERAMLQGTYQYNQAIRLQRLFLLQMDALNKHRGKGPSEQKVTVQHVHVTDNAQAIITGGNVTKNAGGEGGGDGEHRT